MPFLPLYDSYISDESNLNDNLDNPALASGASVTVWLSAHKGGDGTGTARARLWHRDTSGDEWASAASVETLGAGTAAGDTFYFAPGALKALLRAELVGIDGDAKGGGTVALIY